MDSWKPLEIVALVAVAALAIVSVGVLIVWYWLRNRQIELAACSSDDQAARLLGESLAKVRMSPRDVQEVMTTFTRMDSAGKRSLASAIAGVVAATEDLLRPTLSKQVLGVVSGFEEAGRLSAASAEATGQTGERSQEERYMPEEQRGRK
jgi:hypothetical protein